MSRRSTLIARLKPFEGADLGKLFEAFEAGMPSTLAAQVSGFHSQTAQRWFAKWRQTYGTIDCPCGRPATHRAICPHRRALMAANGLKPKRKIE